MLLSIITLSIVFLGKLFEKRVAITNKITDKEKTIIRKAVMGMVMGMIEMIEPSKK